LFGFSCKRFCSTLFHSSQDQRQPVSTKESVVDSSRLITFIFFHWR
jgi:hypothetical protein